MWKRIPKEVATQPLTGVYSDWKPILSVEGYHQCVYCFVNETYFGGVRNFHVEHYKPKTKFIPLTNVYSNLFYACSICNTFKSDDWPNEPDMDYDKAFYPNPSIVNYSDIFEIEHGTHIIKGKNFTSTYLVNRLFLNRKQLVIYRKTNFVEEMYKIEIERVKKIKDFLFDRITISKSSLERGKCVDYLKKFEQLTSNLETVYKKKNSTVPYAREDIERK